MDRLDTGDLKPALAAVRVDWWIVGGWALDLFLGSRARAHADLDVSCFRGDVGAFRTDLPDWSFYTAHDGQLQFLEPEQLVPRTANSLWCRPRGAGEWHFQLMLEARDGSNWTLADALERVHPGHAWLAALERHA